MPRRNRRLTLPADRCHHVWGTITLDSGGWVPTPTIEQQICVNMCGASA